MKDMLIILAMFAAAVFGLPLLVQFAGSSDSAAETETAAVAEFPAEVELCMTATGEIVTVSAKEYITGCLFAQIPMTYEPEALKAQAAASATYALRVMGELRGSGKLPDGADISDDKQLCQPYFTEQQRIDEYGEEYEKYLEKAELAAVYGLSHIITSEGEPIYAVYHAVSAGRTCPSEYIWGVGFDYLRRVDSFADREYINFECVNEMKSEEARLALIRYDSEIEIPADCAKWFTDMNVNEEGYVISVNLGKNTFSGGDIWRIFGLRSPAFTVTYSNQIFTFTTKGFGHGAGMSQYGANELAKSGSSADDILRHYYGDSVKF